MEAVTGKTATAESPRESVGAQIWRILDTPVKDLAAACFPSRRDIATVAENTTLEERALPPSPGQSTFRALVPERLNISEHATDPAAAEAQQNIAISQCIKSSMAWAWRAGPGYVITKIATSTVSSVIPYGLGFAGAKVVDSLIQVSKGAGSSTDALTWFGISAGLSLVGLASSLANRWADSRHRAKKGQEVMNDMRSALTGFSPVEQFSPEVTQLVNRTLQSQWAIQSFGERMFDLVVPVVSAAGAIALIAPHSPAAAALLGAFAVPYFYHSRKRGLEELQVSAHLAEAQNRFGAREWSLLTGPAHIEIKLYGKTANLLEHLKEERRKIDAANLLPEMKQQTREAWVQPLNIAAITGIGLVLLQGVAAHAANASVAGPSIGEYGLLTGALFSLNGSIRAFASNIGDMLRSLPQAQLAHEVMKRGLSRKQQNLPRLELDSAPAIEISDLRFHYPPTDGEAPREVLKGLTLSIKPGELLGIVGESGSGKSSLVNLLCGIYDPIAGSVAFNGSDVSRISKESLWASSAYLRQMSANFWSMTLRENILVGASEPMSDAELLAIAEETGFGEVMKSNDLTLDTVLGQWFKSGKNLSGGEQSLLAMTRQAARGAHFLVLDEPTAGLDQRRADAVLARMRSLTDTTRVVISHDYGIAAQADRILVLDKGEIADIGTHNELLERCDIYRTACERQQSRLPMPPSEEKV